MRRPRPVKRLKQYIRWIGGLSIYKKIAMSFLTVVGVLVIGVPGLYFAADAPTRLFLSDEPSLVKIEGYGRVNTAVVYIGGAGSSPKAQSAGLVPTLQAEAKDVYIVENAPDLFNVRKVIDLVVRTIKYHDKVTFIGGSMGGLVAYDVIKQLREQGDGRHFGVVLIDSPTNGDDVIGVPEIAKAFSWLPLGWITDQWYHPPFDRNAPAVIDLDADRGQLETLWRSYETWKTPSWGDQGDFVFSHDPMAKLTNVSWYFVQSGADTFVDGNRAYANWETTQGKMSRTIVPDGAHLALLNRPRPYNDAVANGMRNVGSAM